MITEFKKYIENWIVTDLSVPLEFFNNLSKCPYAKAALLKDRISYHIVEDNIYSNIEKIIDEWNDSIEVAVIKLSDTTDKNFILELVDILNSKYSSNDFFFLDDHVENKEEMNGIKFNNEKYNVLFLQKKSKLDVATKKLETLGYYKNWTKEYYDQVVGPRLNRT